MADSQVTPSSENTPVEDDASAIKREMSPRDLIQKISSFTKDVSNTFSGIVGSLEQFQEDISQLHQLKQVASVAEQMLSGEHRHHIDFEAKGEVGKLVKAINQTLDNLQQLDKTVHKETGKVPELAQHLDNITQETEQATSQVLENLDEMIAQSERQADELQQLHKLTEQRVADDKTTRTKIDQFLNGLDESANHEVVLQEALEFIALLGEQTRLQTAASEKINETISTASSQADGMMNHAYDIMNVLQFQDITRQKISKVIGLLKEMQSGLFRLLTIFNLEGEEDEGFELSDKHLATQDRILERDAISGKDADITNVDQIIAEFKNKK